jgi:hypothetical protein
MTCAECQDGPATGAVYCAAKYECDVCIECALYLGSVGFDTYRLDPLWDRPVGYAHAAAVLALIDSHYQVTNSA